MKIVFRKEIGDVALEISTEREEDWKPEEIEKITEALMKNIHLEGFKRTVKAA